MIWLIHTVPMQIACQYNDEDFLRAVATALNAPANKPTTKFHSIVDTLSARLVIYRYHGSDNDVGAEDAAHFRDACLSPEP